MLKYVDTAVCFSEIPDEITLCINISQCPNKCIGCHSPYLQEDIGELLTYNVLKSLIINNYGISCVCIMGGDKEPNEVNRLFDEIRIDFPSIKTAWYSGNNSISSYINISNFDYIKIGSFIKDRGPLNNPSTNQKLFKIAHNNMTDITCKFWKNEY